MKKYSVILAVLILTGIGGFFLIRDWWLPNNFELLEPPVGQSEQENAEKIQLNIDNGDKQTTYEVNFSEGLTALEATRIAVGNNLVTSGEGQMAFVTSISGRTAEVADSEFWEFLVNGKQAEVGAGSYQIQPGDIITWKITKFQ